MWLKYVCAVLAVVTITSCGGGQVVSVDNVSLPEEPGRSTPSDPSIAPPYDNDQQQSGLPSPQTQPRVEDITDLVLITGQSNALGAGTAYDVSLDSSDPYVFAFTDEGWRVADLRQIWDRGWFPGTHPDSEPSNNFSLHFGKQLAASTANRVVGFILVTAPGRPISHWSSSGDFYQQIRSKVLDALNQLPTKSAVDGILWHQGESDGRDDDNYSRALYCLIDEFRSESWFGINRPFICGETASLPVNRQLAKLNTDTDPWTACVAGEGLPTKGDGAHFSAAGLRTIGRRYADAYLKMLP